MVGLWGSVENDFNFSTRLRYFVIKCWKERNGSAQSVNQKKKQQKSASDASLPSAQWEAGKRHGKDTLQAENSVCIKVLLRSLQKTKLCWGGFLLQLQSK